MDMSTHHEPAPAAKLSPEFGSWPMNETQQKLVDKIRADFDRLQQDIAVCIPAANGRYLALVKTNLEQACMFAVKGIARPAN